MFDIQLDSIMDPFAIEVSGPKTSFVSTGTAHVRFRTALRTEPAVYSSMPVLFPRGDVNVVSLGIQ